MRQSLPILIALALLAALGMFVGNDYVLGVATTTAFLAIWGQSWNLLSGLSGNVSLGHSVFIAVPAYVTVILLNQYGIPAVLGAVVGIAAAVLLAALIGAATLRLSGPYFTLATLSAAAVVLSIILHFAELTGGPNGIPIPFLDTEPLNLEFEDVRVYYVIALVLLGLVTTFVAVFKRSRVGYYVAAIKSNEAAAAAAGIKIAQVKVVVYCMSAGLTALGAVFYVFFLRFIDPNFIAGLTLSVEIALIAVVGGTGYLIGPIVGAIFYEAVDVLGNAYLGHVAGWNVMVLGFSVVALVMTDPRGLCSLAVRTWSSLRRTSPARVGTQ